MITVTDAANKAFTRYFDSRESSTIRIFYNPDG